MAKLIQPGAPQSISAEQAVGAIMRQLDQINHSLNVMSIKIQTLQNTMLTKKLVEVADLETEWNKVVEELKNSMKAAIVTPEGKPLSTPDGKPLSEAIPDAAQGTPADEVVPPVEPQKA